VSIQLSWTHEYSSAPFYAAVKEGFFAAQGVNIALIEGGFGAEGYIDPRQEVIDGLVDFGISSGSSLIEGVDEGQPIIGVANIMQRSPLAIMTINPNIDQPQDLVGRTILVTDGGARDSLESFLGLQNIALDAVTILPRTDFGVDPLVNGTVDALVAWRINEGVTLEEQGLIPTFFLFSDYGVFNYEFVLFTRLEMLESNPQAIQRVVNAIRQGSDFVVGNPVKAIDHTLTYAAALDRAAQLRRLESTIPLIGTASEDITLGMDQEVWDFSYQRLLSRQAVSSDLDVSRVYTNQFTGSAVPTE
jgi:ABC-type nitrate/sulfonate/bicarbonate transport system substrate-binding protein